MIIKIITKKHHNADYDGPANIYTYETGSFRTQFLHDKEVEDFIANHDYQTLPGYECQDYMNEILTVLILWMANKDDPLNPIATPIMIVKANIWIMNNEGTTINKIEC